MHFCATRSFVEHENSADNEIIDNFMDADITFGNRETLLTCTEVAINL